MMKHSRRRFLRGLSVAVALAALPVRLMARATDAFRATKLEDANKALFGQLPLVESDAVNLKIPAIAENGAVVPVTVSTELEGVQAIYIMIDENPNPLSATFELGASSPADVSTRVKMGKSSTVRGLVKTRDQVFYAAQEVKVTIGGCGG
jgi:sulfur-oxidizing protein SoxY